MARARRSRRGLSRLVRPLNLVAFLPLASRAPTYGRLLLALLQEDRVPMGSKALLAAALGYVALPIDLVPDWLPFVGALDDVAVTVMAVDLFLEAVPRDLLDEKLDELAIERAALDHDLAQVRRLVPRPIRRGIALLPRAAQAGVDIFRRSGADRRLRTWISNEERSG
jgi:uncharacterized membrane protein YkvA (DUF1232 family)